MLPNESTVQRNERLFRCESPVVMVTGSAAPRVGRRVIETFLSEKFRVVIHSHHADKAAQQALDELTAAGHTAMLITGAVEDEAAVTGWVEQTFERFGRIDVLVCSAAIWDPYPLEKTRTADYERFFRVNSLGTALCGQHFGLAMAKQTSGGAIVNIGDWAMARPYRDFLPYLISKGTIECCTRSLAVELAHRNPLVRVNAVMPGPIQLASGISPERQAKIVQASLLKRAGTPDDLAQAVLFLATSPFITGVCLPVDGGRTIWSGDSTDVSAHPDCEQG
ncbi:MAG: SDR family oxidoreductase [Pirellulaceae bacterium]|nr:SDR family oxidoreductase [Pirellulaceae bacterium]